MLFARRSVVPGGLKDPKDIIKATELVYGGQQPALILDMHGRLALNMLKLPYKYVHGYQGAAAIRFAMERNEVQVTTHGLQGYRQGVEQTRAGAMRRALRQALPVLRHGVRASAPRG